MEMDEILIHVLGEFEKEQVIKERK